MMKIMNHKSKFRKEKGQSLIEFSVALVVMLIIIAGIIDLGRVFIVFINLRDAVEEGAIYGSLYPTDCDGIRARTLENVNNIAGVDVDIEIAGVECAIAAASPSSYSILGNEIRVTATLQDFPITMPFMSTIIGRQSVDVRSTITGTILRPLQVSSTPSP